MIYYVNDYYFQIGDFKILKRKQIKFCQKQIPWLSRPVPFHNSMPFFLKTLLSQFYILSQQNLYVNVYISWSDSSQLPNSFAGWKN